MFFTRESDTTHLETILRPQNRVPWLASLLCSQVTSLTALMSMLSQVLPSQQLARSSSSLLTKVLAAEIVSRRCYSSTSTAAQSWSSSARQQKRNCVGQARRPASLVSSNGTNIPLHINDLLQSNYQRKSVSPPAVSDSPFSTKAKRQYESDLIVVLDMDECLIHSQFLNSPVAAQVYAHQLFQKRRANSAASPSTAAKAVDSFHFTLPDGELVHVNVRPGLRDFLHKVCHKFETHIFTAAVPLYADPLLNILDPTQTLFAGRWYRDSCTFDADRQAHVKNLNNLPLQRTQQQQQRVVLVDNNPLSFLTHPNNGILVDSFYNDANDTSLEKVWHLLQELDGEQDVRPKLQQAFGLKQLLQQPQQRMAA